MLRQGGPFAGTLGHERNLVAVLRADGVKFYIPMQACDT